MASSRNSLASMLREMAEQLEHSQTLAEARNSSSSSSSASPSTSNNAVLTPRHPVDAEVARLFGLFDCSSDGRGSTRQRYSPVPRRSSYTRSFCCLGDKNAQIVPNRSDKERLAAAGLGEKHLAYHGSQTNPNQFRDFILEAYPKLRQGGGFELLRISRATKSRQLTLIPCPNEGYNVKHLKDPQMLLGHTTIFIRPLQRNLNLDPASQPESSELAGPPQRCMTCGAEFPFLSIKAHSDDCTRSLQGGSEVRSEVAVSANLMARDRRVESMLTRPGEMDGPITSHTGESVQPPGNVPATGTSQESLSVSHMIDLDPTEEGEWQIDPNPTEAVKKFKEDILRRHATGKALSLTMDLGDSTEERERAILSFYKMENVEWACPLTCTIKGDPAVGGGVIRHFFATIMSKLQYGFDINLVPGGTLLFEGEQDHLIPSTSFLLLESDLFLVAGRMIGHSFLHGGPRLAGLSPAILHVLFGGSPDEATIEIADCPDLDIRQTIKLLDGMAELSAEDKRAVNELALAWDLPVCTSENRKWLLDKLLLHAVLIRTSKQVKQLRRGISETLIWPLLTERRDTIPLLFPRTSDTLCTPQLVLERIKWPIDDEDSDVSLEDACRITGFFRVFIQNASQNLLGKLLEFWVGWSVLPRYLEVEVVKSNFPKSSTCFHLLKLPANYMEYSHFERDILAAIWSTDTGFGLI